jgi:hypothetical protein
LKGLNLARFLAYFLLYSFIATVLHEYFHYMALVALGGEGRLLYGWGLLIFPWDESHVVVERPPEPPGLMLWFTTIGSLATLGVLGLLYLGHQDPTVRATLLLVMMPQLAWTLAEPLAWLGRTGSPIAGATRLLDPWLSYHLVLFASWGVGLLVLRARLKRGDQI